MKIIICVDDNMGTMFNERRQSQDSLLRERILHMTEHSRLLMSCYSGRQFKCLSGASVVISDDFLSMAAHGDFCFVEGYDILPYYKSIEEIILYRWNRKYPHDQVFPFDLSAPDWTLASIQDFSGSSHEKITEEIYVK